MPPIDAIRNLLTAVGGSRISRCFSSSRRLALGGGCLIAATIFAACLAVWDLREDRLADEMKDTKNLAVVLAEQTARSFQAVDLVLQEMQAMALAAAVTTPDEFKLRMGTEQVHDFLAERIKSLPQAESVALVDADGRLTNLSRPWPIPILDISDREYFRYPRDHPSAAPYIGPPVRSKINGAWTIVIARSVSGAAGEFLGVVAGYIEARYFEDFYRAVSTENGESISLFRSDGTLLARFPRIEKMIGDKISPDSPWYTQATSGGTYRTPGYIGGVPRIVSVQPAREYPLAVTTGVSEDEALASWRRQSMLIAMGTLGAIFGFAVLFRALAVQFRKLAQSEARFRDFAQSSSDWLWETDQRHRFAYVSEGVRTFGFTTGPGSVVGRTRLELAVDAGGDPAKWEQHYAVLDRHEPVRNFTYTWTNPNGEEGIAAISGDPFFDDNGCFAGYRGTGRDITEAVNADRKLLEAKEAAEAANLAKSQFLANISHELRTPLNAIIGFSEMLLQGLAGRLQKKQKEYNGLVYQSGQHLLKIINDILDLAHVDSGKFDLHEERGVDVGSIIEASISLTKDRATAGGVSLSVEIEEALPHLMADPTRLKQILLNLVTNAIKFTGPGRSVVVSAHCSADGGIVFEVRDTGVGMTPEEIAIALEPFGQVDAGHTRRHEGTGLGLPLARRLAELHGGSLHVESQKGYGTTVTVTLPAGRAEAMETPTTTTAPPDDHRRSLRAEPL
jgi:PAS domain S-box-containing protein